MSGVEVAGLVLGALPILIQAIESYNEGLDPIKSFMRWERELPQFIRKLRNEHVHYSQTMRLLLEPITNEFELAEMLNEPNGQSWKDKEMASKLEDKLQESYHAYRSTVVDIERITKKIASKLDLDRAAELRRNDLEAIITANPKKGDNSKFEFRKRVKFGMSKKTIKGLLEELGDCNKELERFTDKSDKLETVRKTTKPSFAARLQRIQDLAKYLHSSISSSWSCSCRSHHKTSLLLEHREALFASSIKRPKLYSKTSFTVTFSNPADISTQENHSWTWQEAEILVDEDDDVPIAKPKMSKSVSFGDKPPPPYTPTDTNGAVHAASQEVKDLCASICKLYKSSHCIGFSFDYQSKLLKGPMPRHRESDSDALRSCEIITLDELLNPGKGQKALKLSKRERYSLAVNLASSALQLNRTPWFPNSWSAKDIVFHRTSQGLRPVDIQHPYVSTSTDVQKPSKIGFQNKNTVLLALAIALLELYFGISAQQHQENGGSSETQFDSNPWNQCAIAYNWAENEQEDLSAAFQGAINHCLRCFSDPSASLQDPEFLQAAVESIVLPLQDELSQFLGKSSS